jgi:hypothetical protein
MGFYIETPHSHTNKAGQLVRFFGAKKLDGPPEQLADIEEGQVLVCVVENGPFDAAGVAYSQREMEELADPRDKRPKHWLTLPISTALKLNPSLKGVIQRIEGDIEADREAAAEVRTVLLQGRLTC